MDLPSDHELRDVFRQLAKDPLYTAIEQRPLISILNIVLAIIALSMFAESILAYALGVLPLWAAMTCNLLALYIALNILNDALHSPVEVTKAGINTSRSSEEDTSEGPAMSIQSTI